MKKYDYLHSQCNITLESHLPNNKIKLETLTKLKPKIPNCNLFSTVLQLSDPNSRVKSGNFQCQGTDLLQQFTNITQVR